MPQAINFTGKLHGCNLVLKVPPAIAASWCFLWEGFTTYWPDIQREIDVAYGAGCNVVRLFGDFRWFNNAAITQAQYHSYWNTVLAYCQTVGMKVYPCGAGAYEATQQDALSNAQIISLVNAWLAAIASYNSIMIGVDVLQEVNWGITGTASAIASRCKAVYDGVKAGGTTHPLTFSTSELMSSSAVLDACVAAGALDFLDGHMYQSNGYPSAPATSTITPWRTNYPTYEIVIGEYGDPVNNGDTSNTNFTVACAAVGNQVSGTPDKMRGAFFWAGTDQSTNPNSQYGLTDSSWATSTRAAGFIKPLVNSTASGAGPNAPSAPIVPRDGMVLVSPAGATTDYAGTKVYRNGTQIASVWIGYVDDSANNAAKQVRYSAKVATYTHGDSAESASLTYPGRLPRSLIRRRVAQTFH